MVCRPIHPTLRPGVVLQRPAQPKHRLPLPLEARRRTTGSQTSSSRRIDDLATSDVETPDRLRPERNPRTIRSPAALPRLSVLRASRPHCATSTGVRPQNAYSVSRTPSPGVGPRAATGDPTSDPSLRCRRSKPAQIYAKPERRGRPAGSRAHFLQLSPQTHQ